MRELQDLFDVFPYCLLVALPIMIILSPAATAVGHEFPAHRLAQFELGGVSRGPKAAALSMDARSVPSGASGNLLRKTIVAKLEDVTITSFNDMVASGAGGFLFLLPSADVVLKLTKEAKESIFVLQEHLQSSDFEIPIYFSEETPQLQELLENLGGEPTIEKSASAAATIFSNLASYGYQLVSTNSAIPKAIGDPSMVSIEAVLRGSHGDGGSEAQPTVVVVAHYDSNSLAPSIPSGVDSNGSGMVVLMELARVFGKLYASARTRPPLGLVLLLSSGGAMNYFGSKKWLENHLDHESHSELLSDVAFVACLDTLSGEKLNIHVSKPPKSETHAGKFLANLGKRIEMVHKKINLADELLAWEHERFSIRRLPAFTLSRLESHDSTDRSSILDMHADPDKIYNQVKTIGEALACTLYNYADEGCSGKVLEGSLSLSKDSIATWVDHIADTPRFASMTAGKNDPFVQSLTGALKTAVGVENVRLLTGKREPREPEFILFDGALTTITAYKVKPAVFDLVLTMCIGAYLGVVYLAIAKSGIVVSLVTSLTTASSSSHVKSNGTTPHLGNGTSNGHHAKVK